MRRRVIAERSTPAIAGSFFGQLRPLLVVDAAVKLARTHARRGSHPESA